MIMLEWLLNFLHVTFILVLLKSLTKTVFKFFSNPFPPLEGRST